MTGENPFPGMNPFLEIHWLDVHTTLIGYVRDAIADELPEGLVARSEEHLAVDALDDAPSIRADVGVSERWREGLPPVWTPESDPPGGGTTQVATPEIVAVDPVPERWIEIRTPKGRLVTAIEILSPANKGAGRARYLQKQGRYLHSGANLVEIDLLRGGVPTVSLTAEMRELLRPMPEARYEICVARAGMPERREVYRWALAEPIPTIRVPLRYTDNDIPLALQPLLNRAYRTGRYALEAFRVEDLRPEPSATDLAWIRARMAGA